MRSTSGLTLAELTMAVLVAGILATVAIPGYQKTVERAHWQTAGDVLQTIYAGEKLYYSQNKAFTASIPDTAAANWRPIYMDNPNVGSSPAVTYQVSVSVGVQVAQATRQSSGQMREIDLNTGAFNNIWTQP